MKRLLITATALMLTFLCASGAQAVVFNMFESKWNIDGNVQNSYSGNFGSISYSTSISSSGNHNVLLFVDPEIDEAINTFFNEYGAANGSPDFGQSWEIDEPGYVFGDIYGNFVAGALDGSNGVPDSAPDDVSMALGWNFNLNPGDIANISFSLSPTAPTSGFYLSQTDPDSQATLYFRSDLDIRAGGQQIIPEPSTFVLVGSSIAGLLFYGIRKRKA